MKEFVDQLTESEWVKLIGLILLFFSAIEYISKFWRFGKKAHRKFKTNESVRDKTRDGVFVGLNILIGYAAPVFFLWATWDTPWMSWWLIPKVIAVYIFVSNLLLWWMVRKALKLTKDLDKSPTIENN